MKAEVLRCRQARCFLPKKFRTVGGFYDVFDTFEKYFDIFLGVQENRYQLFFVFSSLTVFLELLFKRLRPALVCCLGDLSVAVALLGISLYVSWLLEQNLVKKLFVFLEKIYNATTCPLFLKLFATQNDRNFTSKRSSSQKDR